MADKTILELTAAGSLSGTESIHIVQGGESRELTLAELAAYVKLAETIVPTDLPYRGARIYRNTDATGLTFPNIVSWNAEEFDTDGFYDAGSPTRFTIPSGITKVEFKVQLSLTNVAAAGGIHIGLRKNSTGSSSMVSPPPGYPSAVVNRNGTTGFSTNIIGFSSPVIPVVAGDFFDVRLNSNISGLNSILGSDSASWFDLKVVEVD